MTGHFELRHDEDIDSRDSALNRAFEQALTLLCRRAQSTAAHGVLYFAFRPRCC